MSAMVGVLITILFSIGAACLGHLLIRKLTRDLDPALRTGLCGLVGLGAIGTLTLFIGLAPGGLSTAGTWIVVIVCAASAALASRSLRFRIRVELPKGAGILFAVAIGVALLFSLISVLAPSDTTEWDTLAYHLALPKLWLRAGQIQPVSFIHHSNFPFAVDNLYIWGLAWGGESGAKAFTLVFHGFGILAIFGLARQVYGGLAGWWAVLAWTTIPAVMWLSGTAYIDVQNGLYAGLGILFAALFVRERSSSYCWLSGIMLGLALGSKYTGLQSIFAVGVVLLAASILGRKGGATLPTKGIAVICGLSLLIGSPWYVKNVIWVGNPVYPFFFKQLGGKNWSDWQASTYSNEQQTFGAARPPETPERGYTSGPLQFQRIGHAILGLAYQPGRYTNPRQTENGGFPLGAVGFVLVGTLLIWLISGRAGPFESCVLATVLVSLAMWFVLSEQSRYIIALGVPLSVMAGGAILRLRVGTVLAAAVVVQALYSFYLLKTFRFDTQVKVVTGSIPAGEYRKAIPFYDPAQYLNETVGTGRVALFDEVFGFLLDVPYFWANPGHTNELGYDAMASGKDLAMALRAKGITYVYVNLVPPGTDRQNPDFQRWLETTGLSATAGASEGWRPAVKPYTTDEWKQHMEDLNWRAKAVLGDAMATGWLALEKQFGSRLVFKVQDKPLIRM
jgi:4-amino-4-deoxy-L-arabinose transferase-like glycosyltransferase